MTSVRILSPAKVNLGLAVLGKREDGYHEINTIMAMIDLYDEITVTARPGADVAIIGMDDVPPESNLMWKAARLWHEASGNDAGCEIQIKKRIPSPAGLGGGSSNAAAVLTALNDLHSRPLSQQQLHGIAAKIGADCPFFLNGPCARATGTGTDLKPMPTATGWIVLGIPRIHVDAKTAKLYGALASEDYGNTKDVDDIERHLAMGSIGDADLSNSFTAPALMLFPALTELRETMIATTGSATLSGAGPALYAIASTAAEAAIWKATLADKAPVGVTVLTARFLQGRPTMEDLQ